MEISLYIACSVDGFIAGENGDLDWLSMVDDGKTDYGYKQYYDSIDALIMGRLTYEQVLGFGKWPYAGKKTYVFSKKPGLPENKDVEIYPHSVEKFSGQMAGQEYKKIWLVGGGNLLLSFIEAKLVDEYIISIIPIILGKGIPLFPAMQIQQNLQLISAEKYDSGLVQLCYKNI